MQVTFTCCFAPRGPLPAVYPSAACRPTRRAGPPGLPRPPSFLPGPLRSHAPTHLQSTVTLFTQHLKQFSCLPSLYYSCSPFSSWFALRFVSCFLHVFVAFLLMVDVAFASIRCMCLFDTALVLQVVMFFQTVFLICPYPYPFDMALDFQAHRIFCMFCGGLSGLK